MSEITFVSFVNFWRKLTDLCTPLHSVDKHLFINELKKTSQEIQKVKTIM